MRGDAGAATARQCRYRWRYRRPDTWAPGANTAPFSWAGRRAGVGVDVRQGAPTASAPATGGPVAWAGAPACGPAEMQRTARAERMSSASKLACDADSLSHDRSAAATPDSGARSEATGACAAPSEPHSAAADGPSVGCAARMPYARRDGRAAQSAPSCCWIAPWIDPARGPWSSPASVRASPID